MNKEKALIKIIESKNSEIVEACLSLLSDVRKDEHLVIIGRFSKRVIKVKNSDYYINCYNFRVIHNLLIAHRWFLNGGCWHRDDLKAYVEYCIKHSIFTEKDETLFNMLTSNDPEIVSLGLSIYQANKNER